MLKPPMQDVGRGSSGFYQYALINVRYIFSVEDLSGCGYYPVVSIGDVLTWLCVWLQKDGTIIEVSFQLGHQPSLR